LEHWKDAYLEATNNLNNASKSEKIIIELLNKTTDLEDIFKAKQRPSVWRIKKIYFNY
jgi:hypothetical protein